MKSNISILIFIALWYGNYNLTNYLVQGEWVDISNKWISVRYFIYEVMFLLLLLSLLFKTFSININTYTRPLIVFTTVILFFSVIDKAIGITYLHHHDILVLGFAVYVADFVELIFKNERVKSIK